MPSKREYQQIRVDQLVPFKDHPFKLCEGQRFEDMVKSVQANGRGHFIGFYKNHDVHID